MIFYNKNQTEPQLITDPKLEKILEELKKREPIFHHPEFGAYSNQSDR